MLKTLSVWNFALIEKAEVEFGEGLNILTGETGAGKSILIEALGTVLGRRASTNLIRTGCEQLRVEAVFLLTPTDKARTILKSLDIDDEALDPDNKEMLVETIRLALNEALEQINQAYDEAEERITKKGGLF